MIRAIINLTIYMLIAVTLSACGTGEFLGFEKKKIPLPGKRVSVLKDSGVNKEKNLSSSSVVVTNPIIVEDWKQSFNSPLHNSFNFISESKFRKFKRVISGYGESSDEKILAQPIISNNKLFFLDASSNVYSFDLENEKLNWKKNLAFKNDKGHNVGGGVAVDEKFLFVSSPYAEILCVEIKSGKIIWKKNTQTPIRATPTLVENKVIVLTLDNRTLVFEKKNGDLVWEHQGIQNSTTMLGQPKVAVDGNLVLTPYSNGDIFALNLTNGAEIWKQSSVNMEQSETSNSFSDIDANPVVLKNSIIIASTSGKIFSLNKKNGNQMWEQYLNTTQTPVVNGNSIYVIHNNKEVINLDLKNGKIRWIAEIKKYFNEESSGIWLSPVLINSKLIIVGGGNNLIILNPYNGEFEKSYSLPGTPSTAPLIVNKKVFLMFNNAAIFSIE